MSKFDKRKAARNSWREKAALMSREDLAAQVVPYVVRNKRVRKAKGKKAGKAPLSKIKSKLKLKVGLTGAKLTAAAKKKTARQESCGGERERSEDELN